jgi:phage recombination protein Bet
VTQGTQLSIFQTYAVGRHMEKEALISTLRAMYPEASMEDLVGFVQVAHRYGLDPWTKEVFLIKSKGKLSSYISVDGYATIVNREPQYDGCEFQFDQDGDGKIIAVTCLMYRKDRGRPTAVTEFLDECIPAPNKDGKISEAWSRTPSRMLRHRAFIQAARLTFGISGALDEGSDVTPSYEPVDITPPSASSPATPKPRRTPPPAGGRTIEGEKAKEPESTAGQKSAGATDTSSTDEFDLDGCLAALSSAKSVEELKTIYNDFEVDDNLQDRPADLDKVQNAFVTMSKALAG